MTPILTKVMEALRPFADIADLAPPSYGNNYVVVVSILDGPKFMASTSRYTLGDLRRAREAYRLLATMDPAEPSEAEVEAAARAIFSGNDFSERGMDFDAEPFDAQTHHRTVARAALRAAARVRPAPPTGET